MSIDVRHGDCLDVLRDMPDNSVDSIVTDPPYGLSNTKPAQVADVLKAWVTGDDNVVPEGRGFMGQAWDGFVPPPAVWKECMRVLKPGGHMAVFAGARTQDLMGLSIRLAGFEIREGMGWIYGSGMPKSLDVSKAIDKQKHDKGDVLRFCSWLRERCAGRGISKRDLDAAAGTSDMGGWWTSNLPHRCAVPTEEQWGKIENLVGALPEWAEPLITPSRQPNENWGKREVVGMREVPQGHAFAGPTYGGDSSSKSVNVTSSHSDAAKRWDGWGTALKPAIEPIILARKPLGGASRLFPAFKYQAKAPKRERPVVEREDGSKIQHATVKPLALMEWLVELITPPNGTILDPFAGSGSTLEAARNKNFNSIGIEREADYIQLIEARLDHHRAS